MDRPALISSVSIGITILKNTNLIFIVETQDGIYMVETKAESSLQDDEVYKR